MLDAAILTRRAVLRRALPLIAANAALPLVGIADTLVISLTGDAAALGGVGLGAAAISVAVYGFYFLRMGATGLTAQALGAGDQAEAQRTLVRAGALGAMLGAAIFALSPIWLALARAAFGGSAAAEEAASDYLVWRFAGAPASLVGLALQGWFIGSGRTREVLLIQAVMSLANVGFDVWFVLGLGWGPAGVGAGTALAEWIAAGVAVTIAWRGIRHQGGFAPGAWERARLLERAPLMRLFAVNRDLMIRSGTLVFGFAWFTNQAARQGDAVLAGNEVLKQFITLGAHVMDAFAFVAEAAVGSAVGARSRAALRRAVRLTSEFALFSSAGFAALMLWLGPGALQLVVRDPYALAAALDYLPYCALAPVIGAAAWQLDGVFIGATRGPAMRNAGLAALACYLATDALLTPVLANDGVWLAFLAFYIYRAGFLAAAYPGLERSLTAKSPP